jgi:RNase P/RNase MRP subunit p29
MNKLAVVLVFAVLLVFAGCDVAPSQARVEGSGNVVNETRAAGNFDRIETEGDMTVIYKKSATASLKISAQENLLPYLETVIVGNVLTVRPKKGHYLNPTNNTSIVVRVSSPNVNSLSLVGSGLLSADTLVGSAMATTLDGSGTLAVGFAKGSKLTATLLGSGSQEIGGDCPSVICNLDGSGQYRLKGKAGNLSVNINSSGVIEGLDLLSQNSTVKIKGSGVCKVMVNSALDVSIQGSGSVLYKGNAQVTKVIEGSGTVLKLN